MSVMLAAGAGVRGSTPRQHVTVDDTTGAAGAWATPTEPPRTHSRHVLADARRTIRHAATRRHRRVRSPEVRGRSRRVTARRWDRRTTTDALGVAGRGLSVPRRGRRAR